MAQKILFVDDEPHVVLLMKRRLEHAGYSVLTAAEGEEAFKKAKADVPDLMIIDQTMPKMSGVELCRKVKAEAPLKNVPVIIYTANTQKGLEEECIQAGAVGIIYKPLVAELLTLVRRIFAGEKIDWGEYTE